MYVLNKLRPGGHLKTLRKRAGLTQKKVEELLGLRKLTIFDYERGRIRIPLETAVELCNLYHCTILELFNITEIKPVGVVRVWKTKRHGD